MFSYRLEYKGCGPFSSPTQFEKVREEIMRCASHVVDKFGTTFLNYYDQRTAIGLLKNKEIQNLIDTHPRGVLQFGFTSKEIMEDMFGLSTDYVNSHWRTQFLLLLDNCPEVVVRVYEVAPVAFHETDEVVYLAEDAELVAEAHSAEDFINL